MQLKEARNCLYASLPKLRENINHSESYKLFKMSNPRKAKSEKKKIILRFWLAIHRISNHSKHQKKHRDAVDGGKSKPSESKTHTAQTTNFK